MSLRHELLLHWYKILHFQYNLFAECTTKGLHRITEFDVGLDNGEIDGLTYYNATFYLWAGEGEMNSV
jgi:hypothetical protein